MGHERPHRLVLGERLVHGLAVTDWPCGVSITITLFGFGFSESAASSSAVAAFMRMVSVSMPEKVPFGNATTLSPGRIS